MLSASVFRLLAARHRSIHGFRWSSSVWQVSSHGRIRDPTGAIRLGSLQLTGYRQASIENRKYLVHRLVAATFLGAPPDQNRWQVNHLDGDPANNHVDNLQYVSNSENQLHAWARQESRAKTGKAVLWRPFGKASWNYCASQGEAGRLLGVAQASVSLCCRGVKPKAGGHGMWYEFKLAAEENNLSWSSSDEVWMVAKYPCEPKAVPNLLVSNHGRVSPARQSTTGTSRGCRLSSGYYTVKRNGRSLFVHRLVAGTFLDEPHSSDMQVNHRDLDRGNNHVENLEFVTCSQNMQHSYSLRARCSRGGKAVQARTGGCEGPWQDFKSIKSASSVTGISERSISRACASAPFNFAEWEFRFAAQESLPGEEWRTVVFNGARAPKRSAQNLPQVPGWRCHGVKLRDRK